jgi:hypothetical protein
MCASVAIPADATQRISTLDQADESSMGSARVAGHAPSPHAELRARSMVFSCRTPGEHRHIPAGSHVSRRQSLLLRTTI